MTAGTTLKHLLNTRNMPAINIQRDCAFKEQQLKGRVAEGYSLFHSVLNKTTVSVSAVQADLT